MFIVIALGYLTVGIALGCLFSATFPKTVFQASVSKWSDLRPFLESLPDEGVYALTVVCNNGDKTLTVQGTKLLIARWIRQQSAWTHPDSFKVTQHHTAGGQLMWVDEIEASTLTEMRKLDTHHTSSLLTSGVKA